MTIFGALGFMAAGAAISELYHRRMWVRYQQGKKEIERRIREANERSRVYR